MPWIPTKQDKLVPGRRAVFKRCPNCGAHPNLMWIAMPGGRRLKTSHWECGQCGYDCTDHGDWWM